MQRTHTSCDASCDDAGDEIRANFGGSVNRTDPPFRFRAGEAPPGLFRIGRTGDDGAGSLGRRLGTSKCSKLVAVCEAS